MDKKREDSKGDLRHQAEELQASEPEQLEDLSPEKMRTVVHELRTHQIELELQNEELRRAQEELVAARDQLADLYDFAPIGYLLVSGKGLVVRVNLAAAEMLGVERGLLVNQPMSAFILDEDEDTYYLLRKEVLAAQERRGSELHMRVSGGAVIRVEITLAPAKGSEEEHRDELAVILTDVTAQRQSERLLRNSEQRLIQAQLIAGMGDFTWVPETGEVTWSEPLYALLGYDKSEPVDFARVDTEIHHPDDRERIRRWLEECLESGEPQPTSNEHRLLHKDGTTRYVRMSLVIERQPGEPVKVVGTVLDITERKQAEEKIKKQQYYLEKAQELGQIGTWELDLRQNSLYWTDENCRIFGVPTGSVVNYEVFLEKVHPADREYVDGEWNAALDGKPYDIEHRIVIGDHTKWVREKALLQFDEAGIAFNAIGFTQDITERKEMEAALREATDRWMDAAKAGRVGLWNWDLVTNTVEYSAEWKRQIGYEDHEVGNSFEEWESRVHPDDLAPTLERVNRALAERGKEHEVEFRFRHKDGSYRWILATASILQDDSGRPIRMRGAHLDITDLRKAEDDLRQSEASLVEAQRVARIGSWSYDVASDRAIWSLEMYRIFGIDPEQSELDWPGHREHIDPRDWNRIDQVVRAAMEQGSSYREEFRLVDKGKGVRWVETIGYAETDPSGTVRSLSGTVQDITKRKEVEWALRENEAFLDGLLAAVPVPVFYKDTNGRYLGANEAFEAFFGAKATDLVGKSVFDMNPPELAQVYHEADRELLEDGVVQQYESQVPNMRGEQRDVVFDKAVFRDEDGAIRGLIGTILDITERKQAEAGLRLSQGRYRSLFEDSPSPLWEVDLSGVKAEIERLRGEGITDFRAHFENHPRAVRTCVLATKILAVNQATVDLHRAESADDLTANFAKIFAQDSYRALTRQLIAIAEGRAFEALDLDTWTLKGDRLCIATHWAVPPGHEETLERVYIAVQDITERERAANMLRQLADRLFYLNHMIRAVLGARSSDEVAETAVHHVMGLLSVDRVSLVAYDYELDEVRVLAAVGLASDTVPKGSVQRLSEVPIPDAFERGQVHFVDDLGQLSKTSRMHAALLEAGIRLSLRFPVMVAGKLVGALKLGHKTRTPIDENEIDVAREVARAVAVAIQRSRLLEQSMAAQAELQALSARLVSSQEQESRRISRELHDEVGQSLTGLKLMLEGIARRLPQGARRSVAEAQELVDGTMQVVRDLSMVLHPQILEDLGLVPALTSHFAKYAEQTGIHIAFSQEGLSGRYPPSIEMAVFRIVQEALTNVARYAGTDEVVVSISSTEEGLHVRIEDHGKGFNVGVVKSSHKTYGLTGMRERAVSVGGNLDVRSKPGSGTRLTAWLPLGDTVARGVIDENNTNTDSG